MRKLPNELFKEHSDNDMLRFKSILDQLKSEGQDDNRISNEIVRKEILQQMRDGSGIDHIHYADEKRYGKIE